MKTFLSVFGCAIMLTALPPKDANAYDGPIVDGHLHLSQQSDAELIREKFRMHGVSKSVIFPREFKAGDDWGISEEAAKEFLERNSDLGYVLLGLQLDRLHKGKPVGYWNNPPADWSSWLKYAEEELASGRRKGLGELIVRHYDYHGRGNGEVDFPIKSKLFESLLDLASRTQRPLVIHAEGEPHVVEALLDSLRQHPKAKVVWAHACGRSDPRRVMSWLASYGNLYCDLGNMTDTGHYGSLWPRAGDWTFQLESGRKIKPEWLRVIEKFPNRLYVGTDVNEVKGWNKAWERRVQRFRRLLDQVSPSAREWLSYKTVESLYGW